VFIWACSPSKAKKGSASSDLSKTAADTTRSKSAKSDSPFQNARLKTITSPEREIVGGKYSRLATGIWRPESRDPAKQLAFPEQVAIHCSRDPRQRGECIELSVQLGAIANLVSIQNPESTTYEVDRWDTDGLVASYGDEDWSPCQRHVLTMDFASGAVSVSDVPTHRRGCETYAETNSYRLVRGSYYVDTTPNNDAEKP